MPDGFVDRYYIFLFGWRLRAGALGGLTVLFHLFFQRFFGMRPFLFGEHPVTVLVEFLHNLLPLLLNLFPLLQAQLRTILSLRALELLIPLALELPAALHGLLPLLGCQLRTILSLRALELLIPLALELPAALHGLLPLLGCQLRTALSLRALELLIPLALKLPTALHLWVALPWTLHAWLLRIKGPLPTLAIRPPSVIWVLDAWLSLSVELALGRPFLLGRPFGQRGSGDHARYDCCCFDSWLHCIASYRLFPRFA